MDGNNVEKNKNKEQTNVVDSLVNFTTTMRVKNNSGYGARNSGYLWERSLEDTYEDTEKIVTEGTPLQQKNLSRKYFNKNGFYKQIITHYGTLLKNMGILIPNPAFGSSLQDKPIAKRYRGAVELVEKMDLKNLLTKISMSVLINGTYYGIVHTLNKQDFTLMDLPFEYCRSLYQDEKGNNIIEFNVQYFDSMFNANDRRSALKTYPKVISSYYRAWKRGPKKDSWVSVPSDMGVTFELFEPKPYLLSLIPITIQYDEAVELEAEKTLSEIKKILIQKVPHLNDGSLLFEIPEAEEMHNGAVDAITPHNPNVSVLTTYNDVEIAESKTTDSVTHTALNQMIDHLYANAGTSPQIFAGASSAGSVTISLQSDTALMMTLANQYAAFISRLVNQVYGNAQISFSYVALNVTEHNKKEFIADSFKLAQYGYSFLLPSLALGLSQQELFNLKHLENDYLKLSDILIPLKSSHTQTGDDEGGRPESAPEEKEEKTEKNEEGLGKGG